MIKFKNQEIELILRVEGYAYPFARDYRDANWLSVRISIHNNLIETYDNNDPCLLTTELIDLKNWIKNILEQKTESSYSIEFIEPCISFKFGRNTLNIFLKYNLNPNYDKDFDSIYIASFSLNQKEMTRILNALEMYIEKFPEKRL